MTLTVYGLSAGSGVLPGPEAVWIDIGGVAYPVTSVAAVPALPNATAPPPDMAYVTFVVPNTLTVDTTVSNPTVLLMVGTGTRLSTAFTLNVAAPPSVPSPAGQ